MCVNKWLQCDKLSVGAGYLVLGWSHGLRAGTVFVSLPLWILCPLALVAASLIHCTIHVMRHT